jgi:hypothetical protein
MAWQGQQTCIAAQRRPYQQAQGAGDAWTKREVGRCWGSARTSRRRCPIGGEARPTPGGHTGGTWETCWCPPAG